jgi:ethanolamine utilization protein EutA (predicted chaperonin)
MDPAQPQDNAPTGETGAGDDADDNLISRRLGECLFAAASGDGAINRAGTDAVCAIAVSPLKTYVCIFADGQLAETACFDLGWNALRCRDGTIIEISEGMETFLDAVAKRLFVGSVLDQHMHELLGELMAETVVNLFARKRPPQVTQRLLSTEPFSNFHAIGTCLISEFPPEALATTGGVYCMGQPFRNGLMGSLADRSIECKLIELPADVKQQLCAEMQQARRQRLP